MNSILMLLIKLSDNNIYKFKRKELSDFTLDKEIVSTCDYSFDEKFLKSWNETFSDKQIESVYDLPDKSI